MFHTAEMSKGILNKEYYTRRIMWFNLPFKILFAVSGINHSFL